ncbi:Zinc finger protein 226 [Eumeta japonica]|uniref:Zinc finger protein 226 n=1 Tax=Eumeta variegata TaxID=151549 RepID=A0A4C1YLG5_EUMVA|nr:Zinc finger protein 226 [Eumeta japonica]
MLEHKNVRPYICPNCGRGFKRKEHLNIHRTLHSGIKKEICPECQRSFYREDHLKKHLQVHRKHDIAKSIGGKKNVTPNIKIEIDESSVKLEPFVNSIIDHIEDEDALQDESDSKNIDPLNFNTWVDDEVYNEKPFMCPICYKKFKRKNHLALHGIVHEKKDKHCTICQKAYHKEEQLQYHMLSHKEDLVVPSDEEISNLKVIEDQDQELSLLVERTKLKPNVCHVCQKRFKNAHKLQAHATTHMVNQNLDYINGDELAYEDFGNHYILSDSMPEENDSQMQSNENQESYMENIVNEENQNILEPQTIMFVDNEELPKPQKVFVCKVCSKPFKRKDHYKIHLHIHTGVKTVFCPECGKGFYRKDHLKKHFTVHRKISQPFANMPYLAAPPAKRQPVEKKMKVSPEITIRAPSNMKFRSPLKIKVPYEVVVSSEKEGVWNSYTVNPTENNN